MRVFWTFCLRVPLAVGSSSALIRAICSVWAGSGQDTRRRASGLPAAVTAFCVRAWFAPTTARLAHGERECRTPRQAAPRRAAATSVVLFFTGHLLLGVSCSGPGT